MVRRLVFLCHGECLFGVLFVESKINMNEIKLGGIKFPKKLIPAKNKPEADKVYTPDWLAEAIVNHYKPWGKCLEPCAGGGAFVKALFRFKAVEKIISCELDRGEDFLTKDFGEQRFDWVVSNFPFSKYRLFLSRCMDLCDNILTLSTTNHTVSLKARRRDMKEKGFFIREICEIDTPKEFPQSGFSWSIIHLSKEKGDCKFSYL